MVRRGIRWQVCLTHAASCSIYPRMYSPDARRSMEQAAEQCRKAIRSGRENAQVQIKASFVLTIIEALLQADALEKHS
jgi:hypothetical protein